MDHHFVLPDVSVSYFVTYAPVSSKHQRGREPR